MITNSKENIVFQVVFRILCLIINYLNPLSHAKIRSILKRFLYNSSSKIKKFSSKISPFRRFFGIFSIIYFLLKISLIFLLSNFASAFKSNPLCSIFAFSKSCKIFSKIVYISFKSWWLPNFVFPNAKICPKLFPKKIEIVVKAFFSCDN